MLPGLEDAMQSFFGNAEGQFWPQDGGSAVDHQWSDEPGVVASSGRNRTVQMRSGLSGSLNGLAGSENKYRPRKLMCLCPVGDSRATRSDDVGELSSELFAGCLNEVREAVRVELGPVDRHSVQVSGVGCSDCAVDGSLDGVLVRP